MRFPAGPFNFGSQATKAYESLTAAIKDESIFVQTYAIRALGKIGPKESLLPTLILKLKRGPGVVLRAATAFVIGSLEEKGVKAIPILLASFKTHSGRVVYASATAFAKIGSASIPPLMKLVETEDRWNRVGDAYCFGKIGGQKQNSTHDAQDVKLR